MVWLLFSFHLPFDSRLYFTNATISAYNMSINLLLLSLLLHQFKNLTPEAALLYAVTSPPAMFRPTPSFLAVMCGAMIGRCP
jgi:hypothetical protein